MNFNRFNLTVAPALLVLASTGMAGVAKQQPKPKLPAAHAATVKSPASLPSSLDFEPNMGQSDPEVRYLARRGSSRVFITDRGAILTAAKLTTGMALRNQLGSYDGEKVRIQSQDIQMTLVGGAKPAGMTASEPRKAISSYYIGNDPSKWIPRVPRYGRVDARQVYPGVDLSYYATDGRLEYDFIVAPGADPHQIHLAFNGQKSIRLDQNGDLILATAMGDFVQHKPKVYQNIQGRPVEVAASYRIDGGNVGFELARFDASKPLVIDPVLASSTYLGGSSADAINAMSVTPIRIPLASTTQESWAVVAGYTTSANIPHISGDFYNGNGDAYIAILDPDQSQVYQALYFGGSQLDMATSVSVDPASNTTCVGGLTYSTDFPLTSHPWESTGPTPGYSNGFVTCFASGTTPLDNTNYNLLLSAPVASTYIGRNDRTVVNAVDFSRDSGSSTSLLYVGGSSVYSVNLDSPLVACFNSNHCAGQHTDTDGFAGIFTYYFTGASQFNVIQLGGSGDDAVTAVTGGDNGFVAVGNTQSADLPQNNSLKPSKTGSQNAMVFVYRMLDRNIYNGGSVMFSYYGSNTGNEIVIAASSYPGQSAIGPGGHFAFQFAGATSAVSWPAVGSLNQSVGHGGYDGFVTQIALGNTFGVEYSTLFGGNGDDYINALAVDSYGTIYAAGSTASTNLPTVLPLTGQSSLKGAQDAMVLKFGLSNSTPDFVTYLGGISNDSAVGLGRFDNSGNIYITGNTSSADFPTLGYGGLPIEIAYSNNGDGFVSRIYLSDSSFVTVQAIDTSSNLSVTGGQVSLLINNCQSPSSTALPVTFTCSVNPTSQTVYVQMPDQFTSGTGQLYQFMAWKDNASTSPQRVLSPAYANLSTYSVYYNRVFPLTITTAGTGSGTFTPASGTMEAVGSTTNIVATANVGSTFTGWTGATPADTAALINASNPSAYVQIPGAPVHVIANFTLTVKTNPVITWTNPAAIAFGSALGSAQLNATATVPGVFAYTPSVGAVLPVGTQTLNVTFTPTDTTTYNTVSASVQIVIQPNSNAGLVVTRTLARNGADVVATIRLANPGSAAVNGVQLTTTKFGAITGTPLPQNIGTIAAGGVAITTVTLPAITTGSSGVLTLGGTYTGGSFNSSSRATMP